MLTRGAVAAIAPYIVCMRSTALTYLILAFAIGLVGCQSSGSKMAQFRNEEGDYTGAVYEGRRAVARNPNDASAHFQLGIAYTGLDSVGSAYGHFARAMELRPNDPVMKDAAEDSIEVNYAGHYLRGQAAFNSLDLELAAHHFELATEADPRRPDAYFKLGTTYALLAKHDVTCASRAASAFEKYITKEPDTGLRLDALEDQAAVLVVAGRDDEALECFRTVIKTDSTRYAPVERVALDFLDDQEWSRSIGFLELASQARTKNDKETFKLPYDIGVALYGMREEDPDAAARSIAYFQKALEMQPDEALTILATMRTCVYLENWTEAIHWGERYVRLRPEDKAGWRYLEQSYEAIGDDVNAEACRRRAE